MEKLHCRVCMDGIAESLGKIPECREFAGQLITPPIQGGVLWHCRASGQCLDMQPVLEKTIFHFTKRLQIPFGQSMRMNVTTFQPFTHI